MADEDGAGDGPRGGTEGGVQWETYPAGAALLGMKTESFRRLAFRRGWRRTLGNDGSARVAVPMAEISQRRDDHPHGAMGGNIDGARGGAPPVARGGATLAEPQALGALADALRQERERRELAEAVAVRAEGEAAGLREAVRLAEAGTAVERVARQTAEAREAEAMSLARQVVSQLDATHRERVEAQAQVTDLRHHLDRTEAERDGARTDAAVLRDAVAREATRAQAARKAQQVAEAAAEVLTSGGRFRQAWAALRRGRA